MNETSIQINETFYRLFIFALAWIEIEIHVEICTYLFETKLNGIFSKICSDLLWDKKF